MKKLIYISTLFVTAIAVLSFSSCKQKKTVQEGTTTFDTIPATTIKVMPEYLFNGELTLIGDSAILKETISGTNIAVSTKEAWREVVKAYKEAHLKTGKKVYARLQGYLNPSALMVTQMKSLSNDKDSFPSALMTGEFKADGQLLTIRPNHTYLYKPQTGKEEQGKWFQSTDDVLVFGSDKGYKLMKVNFEKKTLKNCDDTQTVFNKI
ncbi:MAG: hypothetical protein RR371_05515 [Bacteroides sp.]